jgi:multimeric flavodoxin WrbA
MSAFNPKRTSLDSTRAESVCVSIRLTVTNDQLGHSFPGLTNMDEITGGSPYGASTLAKGDGSRQPSANELDGARYQGKHVAQITAKLARNQ